MTKVSKIKQPIVKTVMPKYDTQQEFDVIVTPGESIYLTCFYKNMHDPKTFENFFKVGDQAEYDSWNLRYIGTITQITENNVIIDPGHGSKKRRLPLGEFCSKNYKFNLKEVEKYNAEESMCI